MIKDTSALPITTHLCELDCKDGMRSTAGIVHLRGCCSPKPGVQLVKLHDPWIASKTVYPLLRHTCAQYQFTYQVQCTTQDLNASTDDRITASIPM